MYSKPRRPRTEHVSLPSKNSVMNGSFFELGRAEGEGEWKGRKENREKLGIT